MSWGVCPENRISDIASAIKEKSKDSTDMSLADMPSRIRAIPARGANDVSVYVGASSATEVSTYAGTSYPYFYDNNYTSCFENLTMNMNTASFSVPNDVPTATGGTGRRGFFPSATMTCSGYTPNVLITGGPTKLRFKNVTFTGDMTDAFKAELSYVGWAYGTLYVDSVEFENCSFSNASSIMSFEEQKNITSLTFKNCGRIPTSSTLNSFFKNCASLTSLDLSSWEVSGTKAMMSMFKGCGKLEDLNLSGWVVDSSSSVDSMFKDCYKLKSLDLSSWGASGSNMFDGCAGLTSLKIHSEWCSGQTRPDVNIESCTQLPLSDVIALINNLGVPAELSDQTFVTYDRATLELSSVHFNQLTDAQLQVATNKGWVIYYK